MKHLGACMVGVALGLAPRLLPAASAGGAEVRAYMNDSCIVADEPYFMPESQVSSEQKARALPLLGIVIGKLTELLIKYAMGHASAKIQNTAARKDTYYGLTREMNLFRSELDPAPSLRLNGRFGCMTIVTAKKFMRDDADCTRDYLPREIARETLALPESEWTTTRRDDSVENQLRRANICLDGRAQAVYEARFEFSDDGTAYRLRDAGYRVNELLTAPLKGTTRSVFYTIELATPGKQHDQQDVISTAWVNVGPVVAGARRDAAATDNPSWLHVPALSADARRAYEEETRAYQELAGEANAAKRSLAKNRRVVDELQRRIATAATPEMATALGQEKLKVEVQIQVLESELQATTAEYAALPRKNMEFMPVSVRVGVTESRSEASSLLALGKVMSNSGGVVASKLGDLSTSLVSRSIDPVSAPAPATAARTDAAPGAGLDAARAAYYDKLMDYKAATAAGSGETAAREQLADAKLKYNAERRAVGVETLP